MSTKSPTEWWLWTKHKRGECTLSIDPPKVVELALDYRSRVALRGDTLRHSLHAARQCIATESALSPRLHDNLMPVVSNGSGSMATFHTMDRVGDLLYRQFVLTPPLFQIDTVYTTPTGEAWKRHRFAIIGEKAFPILLQPWLHCNCKGNGKSGWFYSLPYDSKKAGYRSLELMPIGSFPPYQASGELRERLIVATDAYLQAGKPDERFVGDGPRIGHDGAVVYAQSR